MPSYYFDAFIAAKLDAPLASAYGGERSREMSFQRGVFLKRWFPRRSGLTAEQCTGSPVAAHQIPVSPPSDSSLDRRIRRSEPPRILPASHRPALVTLALAHRHFTSAVPDGDTWCPRRSHVLLAGDLRSPAAAVRVLAER